MYQLNLGNYEKHFLHNLPYLFWLLFYFLLFSLIGGASAESFQVMGFIYGVSLLVSLTIGETIYRMVKGVRQPQTEAEVNLLLPVFNEVYTNALYIDQRLSRNIKIYIYDTTEINAFAFGRSTLIVTSGAIQFLPKYALYGLIAHELGHFANYDPACLMAAGIGNFSFVVITKALRGLISLLVAFVPNSGRSFIGILLKAIVTGIHTAIIFIGDLILTPASRYGEYSADNFAFLCGYGECLVYALKQFQHMNMTPAVGFIDRVLDTHPKLEYRIAALERCLYW